MVIMSRNRILVRILTPLAFLAACGVLIFALLESLFPCVLAGAGLCAAAGYLIYHMRQAG